MAETTSRGRVVAAVVATVGDLVQQIEGTFGGVGVEVSLGVGATAAGAIGLLRWHHRDRGADLVVREVEGFSPPLSVTDGRTRMIFDGVTLVCEREHGAEHRRAEVTRRDVTAVDACGGIRVATAHDGNFACAARDSAPMLGALSHWGFPVVL